MNIVAHKVTHKLFGTGRVQAREGRVLYVLFQGEKELRTFLYPDAFADFLTVEDPDLCQQISDDITAIKLQAEREQLQKRLEKEKRLAEKRSRALELAQLHRSRTAKAKV